MSPVDHVVNSLLRRVRSAIAPMMGWLSRVPVDDPIDRRNAPTMQLLFLVFGTTLPISWARHLSTMDVPSGWLLVGAMDMVTALLAFYGVVLIRRGRFRTAVTIFLSALLLALLIGHLKIGFQTHSVDQTSQMLSLAIGGLVLGRRALWSVFVALMLIFTAGFAVDAVRAAGNDQSTEMAFHYLPSAIFSYFVVTLVLDRCITALRSSLSESQSRGQELQREIVERERAQAQLVHAQKMEAVGRLASGVAHDFNNILGVVVGYTEARHQLDDTDLDLRTVANEMADALEGIEQTAIKGIDLNKRLLYLSRRDAVHPVMFDVGQALHELQPMLRRLLPRNIVLSVDPATAATPVFIDRGNFELAMLNIASNARDALPDGGHFRITTARMDDVVEIRLADDGPGIDPAILDRVFEPFFSTKPAGTGTGLGLAMTHCLVSCAKGQVALESAPGRGTVVQMRLPLAVAAVPREAPRAGEAYTVST